MSAVLEAEPRAEQTVESWAAEYVTTTNLAHKFAPPPVPSRWEEHPTPLRIASPGRPPSLQATHTTPRSHGPRGLTSRVGRARLMHTCMHHELQSAELFAWALLAFPETPRAFRVGLLNLLADEVRHVGLYRAYLATLDTSYGDYPVREWFWERVPQCPTATHFTALLGIGFEGGNLDHTQQLAQRFRSVGDEAGARLQEQISAEELPHVRFAWTWFKRWTSDETFDGWRSYLVPPLTPTVLKGRTLDRSARKSAGFSEAFLEDLERWNP